MRYAWYDTWRVRFECAAYGCIGDMGTVHDTRRAGIAVRSALQGALGTASEWQKTFYS